MRHDDGSAAVFYSPEEVADLYGFHVGTVRRYIREGRLDATRIGNRYRIASSDLDAFSGRPADAGPRARSHAAPLIDVSTVVDLDPVGRDAAERLTALLLGAAKGRDPEDPRLRIEVIHDPSRERLKIVIIGTIAQTAAVLGLINAHQEL